MPIFYLIWCMSSNVLWVPTPLAVGLSLQYLILSLCPVLASSPSPHWPGRRHTLLGLQRWENWIHGLWAEAPAAPGSVLLAGYHRQAVAATVLLISCSLIFQWMKRNRPKCFVLSFFLLINYLCHVLVCSTQSDSWLRVSDNTNYRISDVSYYEPSVRSYQRFFSGRTKMESTKIPEE